MKEWIHNKPNLFIIALLFLAGVGQSNATGIAPDFAIENLAGGKVSLSQYQGQLVVLDFWSVTCYACKVSIPELNQLQKKYQDQGLVVIGITIDRPERASNELLKDYKKFFNIHYIIARADQQILEDYFPGQKRFNLPTSFIIDRQGRIAKRYEGFDPGAIEKDLKAYLKNP